MRFSNIKFHIEAIPNWRNFYSYIFKKGIFFLPSMTIVPLIISNCFLFTTWSHADYTNPTSTNSPQSTSKKNAPHLKRQEFVSKTGTKTKHNNTEKERNFTHILKPDTLQTQTPSFFFSLNKNIKRDSLKQKPNKIMSPFTLKNHEFSIHCSVIFYSTQKN